MMHSVSGSDRSIRCLRLGDYTISKKVLLMR
jgi:hypothetical protein